MSNVQKESKTKAKPKNEKKNDKNKDNHNDQDDNDSVTKEQCGFQCGKKLDAQLKQSSIKLDKLKDEIILDTGSTFEINFINKKLMVCI